MTDGARDRGSRVVLYSRPECHLCDEARRVLLELRDEIPFELRELDIEADERLLATHLERIPVIEVDGVEVCALGVDVAAVRAALRDGEARAIGSVRA